MASRHWLYFGGFVISSLLVVGAGLLGFVEALTVLSGGVAASEELLLLAVLGAAAEWIIVGLIFGVLAAIFFAATVVSVLRNASIPRDDRLVPIVERLERQYPTLRQFDVSEKVRPTTQDRQQQLKKQYVAGEISDAEFERRMGELVDESNSTEESQSVTGRNVGRDGESR